MTTIHIRNGRVIDPIQEIDQIANVVIQDGKIVEIAESNSNVGADGVEMVDASGLIVCPGFIDPHVALREPGFEEDETTETGTAAALAGGFTTVAAMPNTLPVVDNQAAAEFVRRQAERAGYCNVVPLGAVTKNLEGQELADIGHMRESGAVAFTDGKRPLANPEIMRRALEYTSMFNCPILNRPHVPELVSDGIMHEGDISTLLGLRSIPAAAEDIMVGRDIALAEMTGGRIHLMCISTQRSVEQIRRAKRNGIAITADVTPHHLLLTDETMQTFESRYKIEPPLRTQRHIDELIAGLKDGTLDMIVSDHEPYAAEKTDGELDLVPFGNVGLETLLPLCVEALIAPQHLSWPELLARLTINPAKLLGLDRGTLRTSALADITLIDPDAEWTIDPTRFHSKSRNTAFAGRSVRGRVKQVFIGGELKYRWNTDEPVGCLL